MTTTNAPRTLAQRIAEGRIPVAEALHYAMSLAECLRKLHDAGKAHGAVMPANIALTATGLDLIPSLGPPASVTPYTAPEVAQGHPADARSDVFSFGALVFEMLTGRRAFEGEGQTALTLALCNTAPPASGSAAVDRLVAGCVAKSPAARWQRMQKILMELKLLTVAARRADAPATSRATSDAGLRSEIKQLESRLNARLAAQESALSQVQQSAGDAMNALRESVSALAAQLATVRQQPAQEPVDIDALMAQIDARLNETVRAMSTRIMAQADEKLSAVQQLSAKAQETVGGITQRVANGEQGMEELRKHFATLQSNIAGDLHDFEQSLKAHTIAIESARTAMAQTDDLVERVVEALELLQSSVLDQHETVVN